MACTGIEYCKLAIVETKASAARPDRRAGASACPDFDEPLTINVNGCPNSCARIQVADIGLKGQLVVDDNGEQVEGFQIHLGGSMGVNPGFGRKVRGLKTTAEELPDYVERVVTQLREAEGRGRDLRRWVQRADEADLQMTERAVPFHCPYCGDEDLEPYERRRRLVLPVLRPRFQAEVSRESDVTIMTTLVDIESRITSSSAARSTCRTSSSRPRAFLEDASARGDHPLGGGDLRRPALPHRRR